MKAITQSADSGLNFENAKSYASATGLLAAGFLVAHNGLRLIKMQDSLLANLGLTAVAVAGAMQIENPWVKLALIGVAAYAGVKTLSLAVKEVTAPGDKGAAGLSGFIPESVKGKVRAFLPTFGSVGEFDQINGTGGTDGVDDIGDLDEPLHNIGNDDNKLLGMGEVDLINGDNALLGEAEAMVV